MKKRDFSENATTGETPSWPARRAAGVYSYFEPWPPKYLKLEIKHYESPTWPMATLYRHFLGSLVQNRSSPIFFKWKINSSLLYHLLSILTPKKILQTMSCPLNKIVMKEANGHFDFFDRCHIKRKSHLCLFYSTSIFNLLINNIISFLHWFIQTKQI